MNKNHPPLETILTKKFFKTKIKKGDRKKESVQCWGNVARSFLEISFKNMTGTLLFC
ncbi:hypothetical protein [Enterococcus faecium]|uniref:hypothetical protein n=1 Tax=Enterococcus faecium TaxID=1352 RepID=UPI00351660CD